MIHNQTTRLEVNMPNCFQLTLKGHKEASMLQDVDAHICQHFNTPCHEKHWHHGWYNYIGFMIAMGKTFEWLRRDMDWGILSYPDYVSMTQGYEWHMRDIIDFLDQNYTTDAWCER